MTHLTARRPAPGAPGDVTRARVHHVFSGDLIQLDWLIALNELEVFTNQLAAQVYLELWAAHLARSRAVISDLVFRGLRESDPSVVAALLRGSARNPRVMEGV